jgi:hypothetical protein
MKGTYYCISIAKAKELDFRSAPQSSWPTPHGSARPLSGSSISSARKFSLLEAIFMLQFFAMRQYCHSATFLP